MLIRDISVHLIPYRANVIHQNLRTNDLDNHRLRNYNLNKYNIIEQKNINTKHLHPLMQSSDADAVLGFTKPPILLIGSGITHRYTINSPSWKDLLQKIASRIGIDEIEMMSYINHAKSHCDKDIGYMPRVATELEDVLNRRLMDGIIKADELFDDDEMRQYMGGINPIKILASSEFMQLKMTENENLLTELKHLKRLSDVIPCIITTNYDTFLEENVFDGKFKVYSRVSDYYLSSSQGIGEIYKIHGTCTDPETMVLNESDYRVFMDRSKIVTAKMLSVLCDYPMLVLGHSLDDTDIRGIIYDLISSLDADKLREVEKNIIYVTYSPGKQDLSSETTHFDHKGRRLSIKTVATDNFGEILEYIASMEASVSPMTIRKIRQVVKKVAIQEVSNGERYKIIGIDDIAEEDADKLVVVITDRNNLRLLEEIPLYTADRMVEDLLSGDSKFNPRTVVNYFLSSGKRMFPINQYVPIFQFIKESGYGLDSDSQFLKEYIEKKRKQFNEWLPFKVPKSCSRNEINSIEDIKSTLPELSGQNKSLMIMQAYDDGILDSAEAMNILRNIHRTEQMIPPTKTYLYCAITYIGFRELGFDR